MRFHLAGVRLVLTRLVLAVGLDERDAVALILEDAEDLEALVLALLLGSRKTRARGPAPPRARTCGRRSPSWAGLSGAAPPFSLSERDATEFCGQAVTHLLPIKRLRAQNPCISFAPFAPSEQPQSHLWSRVRGSSWLG